MKRNIILHLFQYRLLDIIPFLDKIKEQGFTHIQISPIQKVKEDNGPWWMLYQSCGLEIGNKQIGTKEDLQKLCIEAHKRGLRIICDVILNHIAGDNYGNLIPCESADKLLTSNKYFFKEQKVINNWDDRKEVISYCCKGLPTLRLDNFEGPLDLLCYLIDKNKMDIYEVKISDIADQYVAYLKEQEELNLEVASEFIVMATTLILIKSKSLTGFK